MYAYVYTFSIDKIIPIIIPKLDRVVISFRYFLTLHKVLTI